MTVSVKFCGAAGTVTGSCYFVEHARGRFLVDCGLFQGSKTLKELNYGDFPFDPRRLDFVLLTHAHIDHSGLIPKLVKIGFAGPIYATAGTCDLVSYMWPDSGTIQESEVEFLNRRNVRRGKAEVEPIYTQADAETALKSLRPIANETWVEVGPGVRVRIWNAGHILGAVSIEVEIATELPDPRLLRLLFSGDIGPEHKLFHPDPEAPQNLDFVFCEATYGGRRRARVTAEERRRLLADEIKATFTNGGVVLIPAFAVERTQELLSDLGRLFDSGTIPLVPVFIDSPLAIRATDVFTRHRKSLESEGRGEPHFRHPQFHFTETVEQSVAIDRLQGRMIVIAGSGMCEAGRIRHHLKSHLWRPNATVLLVGYQPVGTLGNLLAGGATAVRIQGEDIQVRARIRMLDAYSGHADGEELVAWVAGRQPIKGAVYLTHGEEDALNALRAGLVAAGFEAERVVIPRLDDEFDLLDRGRGPRQRPSPRRLPAEFVGHPDWHNDLAQFSLDLRARLEACADERGRKLVLRRVQDALGSVP